MATPHISAQAGDFAKTVLMPGDPLRAQFIAETYLQQVRQVTAVRGMLGFTGTYQGLPVSVMGSGMGMPSIGIYSYELFTHYGVENIIRVGSAGSYSAQAKVYDVVLGTAAYSESSFARVQRGFAGDTMRASEALSAKLRAAARALGIPLLEGTLHSSDVFYRDDPTPYWEDLRRDRNCLAVEMESFALFCNAQATGKQAACLVTISDSFVTADVTDAQERQSRFTAMMEIALNALFQ
jgi:purine-nucleoside phosphorylase